MARTRRPYVIAGSFDFADDGCRDVHCALGGRKISYFERYFQLRNLFYLVACLRELQFLSCIIYSQFDDKKTV
jgi:hypothetical protein